MTKKSVFIVTVLLLAISTFSFGSETDNVVVSLGDDLTNKQKEEILRLFNVEEDINTVKVTNQEERKYLGKYVDDKLLGTKSLSCAYVRELADNQGIDVETYNITWVTKEMYMNALVTAGVKNAKVKVAAPVNVSGTAALTGILKAFEGASGNNITEEEKEIANEEIAKTGKLGQEIGKDNASKLIKEIKEEIIKGNVKSEKEIREIVIRIAGDFNINLNSVQINEIVKLMENISKLNLNLDEIKGQLREITNKVNEIAENNKEVKSLLQRILDFIESLFGSIFTWVGNLFK